MTETSTAGRPIAYLNARYPTLSMIFVIREVVQLRKLGWRVDCASVNDPDRPPQDLTAVERSESEVTYYVKRHGLAGALAGHAHALRRHPGGWWRGLTLAVRLAGADLRGLALNLAYFTEATMVGRWMQARGQRHVHVHLGSQPATVGMFVREVFGLGLSITVHGPDEFYDAHRQYLREKVMRADFVVCISDFARSQLMLLSPQAHWHKFVVCRLGVDPAHFAPRPPPAGGGPFEILCVGRLTPAKGQHILLDAVNALRARGRTVRLRVVGGGVDDASLRAHARALGLDGEVVFEGAVNQDHIRALYAKADCFCLPSFAEGIPVVLMEAMAMTIPVVTTGITGVPELIRDGVDGLLVPPSSVESLVAAIERLIDDPALRERLGDSGRRRVQEHYDLARNVEQLTRVFAERVPS